MEIIKEGNLFILIENEKRIGKLEHYIHDDYIDAAFIGVVPEYRGTDASKLLLDRLMRLSDEMNLKIEATCGFMDKWFSKNEPTYLRKS